MRKIEAPQFKDTLGWVHYQQGEHKAALPLLEDAATALPNIAMVHYHLGLTYAAVGDNTKAAEQLKKALELAPTTTHWAKDQNRAEKVGELNVLSMYLRAAIINRHCDRSGR